jgi:nitrate reductase alpha subunit
MNDKDADILDIKDNDWVEIFNDNGVVVTRAVVSRTDPTGYLHAISRPRENSWDTEVPPSKRTSSRRAQ